MEVTELMKWVERTADIEEFKGRFVVAFADGTIMSCEDFRVIEHNARLHVESMRERFRITHDRSGTYFNGSPALLMAVMAYKGEVILKYVGRRIKPLKAIETLFGVAAFENLRRVYG